LICSAIFFSKFDSTLTEYHRFAIVVVAFAITGKSAGHSFLLKRLFRHAPNKKVARHSNRSTPDWEVALAIPFNPGDFKGIDRIAEGPAA
jgi:hypothetical protein